MAVIYKEPDLKQLLIDCQFSIQNIQQQVIELQAYLKQSTSTSWKSLSAASKVIGLSVDTLRRRIKAAEAGEISDLSKGKHYRFHGNRWEIDLRRINDWC